MKNYKQAQSMYDSMEPSYPDEWVDSRIQDWAEELAETGSVHIEDIGTTYLKDLESWIESSVDHSKLIQAKINKYKLLQTELCESMLRQYYLND